MRLLGALFLAFGAALGGWFGFDASLGEALFALEPAFLNTFQAGVQRRLSPWLWDAVILPVLLWPVWVLPGVLGAGLLLLGWRRRG
jgi:uncharacterized RDD family membrane protein YckC